MNGNTPLVFSNSKSGEEMPLTGQVMDRNKLRWSKVSGSNIDELWNNNTTPAHIAARVYDSGVYDPKIYASETNTYHAYVYDRKGNVLEWDIFLDLDKAKDRCEGLVELQ